MTDSRALSPAGPSIWWYAVPFVLLLAIYLPALRDLVVTWATDDNYSHGFLVPLVSGYLAWGKRKQIAELAKQTDQFGLWIVAAAMVLFVIANGAAEYFTLRISFLLCLVGLLWYLFGRNLIRLLWFECFLLLFMIPVPYVLYYAATFPMQMLATKITVFGLKMLGASVVQQGNIIHIAGYSLEVAEACSGIRSLMALLALGAIYAHTSQKGMTAKIILFLSTIPIAVVANVFRVGVTALLVYIVSPEAAEEPMHSIMGLMVFVIAFVLLFLFGEILKRVFK